MRVGLRRMPRIILIVGIEGRKESRSSTTDANEYVGRRMAVATRTQGTPMRVTRTRRLARGRLPLPLRSGPSSVRARTPLTAGPGVLLPAEDETSS